jgi:hypothetical protein
MTGWQRPAEGQLDALPRPGKVGAIRFKDDGVTPNHPRWPLLVPRISSNATAGAEAGGTAFMTTCIIIPESTK